MYSWLDRADFRPTRRDIPLRVDTEAGADSQATDHSSVNCCNIVRGVPKKGTRAPTMWSEAAVRNTFLWMEIEGE